MTTHRPVLLLALAFIVGILAAPADVPVWGLVLMLVVSALGAVLIRASWLGTFFLMAVFCACGFLSFKAQAELPQDHIFWVYQRFSGGEIGLRGVVVTPVIVKQTGRGYRTMFTLRAASLTQGGRERPSSGLILINAFERLAVSYGDEIFLRGKVHSPFDLGKRGRLSYRDYLARRKVLVMMSLKKGALVKILSRGRAGFWADRAMRFRTYLNDVFDRYLSRAESGLMKSLVTGDRSGLPSHVREIFLRTGTVHIIAISGLNIGMVAFGVYLLLSMLSVGRIARMALTVPVLVFYTVMAGADPPVVRSVIMTIVFLCSFMIEREQDAVNTLAWAALVILGWDPGQLFDIGFQLSFVSVLAIIVLTPCFLGMIVQTGISAGGRGGRFWAESLAVSLAAFTGVTPLVLYYFYLVTPVSVLANLPVVPLVGVVTALGALLGVLGGVAVLAWPVAWCLKATLNLMVGILYAFSLIPGGSFVYSAIPAMAVVGIYLVMALFCWRAHRFFRAKTDMAEAWKLGL